MKKLITFIALFISLQSIGQNVAIDKDGNFKAITATKAKDSSKATGKTFTDAKGVVYAVYVSSNDKLYVIRTSKTGNTYKQYLTVKNN